MDRIRMALCLRKLNEAHEALCGAGAQEYTASDLRLLDAIDGAIDTACQVMASNRALEQTVSRRHP